MKRIKASFKFSVNDNIEMQQIIEWVRFELRDIGSIDRSNPLSDNELIGYYIQIEEEDN